jgi:predicted nucleotidyltransferase component of viral defense system
MISKQEVMAYARQLNLMPNIIEKDYVLNWVLAGIASRKNLNNKWVFKGGTCLKKCFFENYRFSEDLDFTLLEVVQNDTSFFQTEFRKLSEWVYDNSGIEILKQEISFEVYKNPRHSLSVRGRISYRGPMQRRNNLSRIKLDLTSDEQIVLAPEYRKIYHPYSDNLGGENTIYAYCLEEIFAEKFRALIDRLRPRDLYDVINLYQQKRFDVDREKFIQSLHDKCHFKKIALPTMDIFLEHQSIKELESEWDHMLAHQIHNLLPFTHYWEQLPIILNWLYK